MAKLVGDQQYSVVTDHLGTPVLMTDADGNAVWSASMSAYGELRELEGDRQACPFRWPGQYEDAETGLYYNRFRYYDAEAGAYVSQDPLGLAGGFTPYSYAADVNRSFDALGLKDKVFWSGGDKAREAAEAYAKSIGGEILEMTPTGQALEGFTKGMDWHTEAKPLWEKTSQAFAGAAPSSQRKAVVFIDPAKYRGLDSVWEKFEKPILKEKGIFTEMRDITKCQ